MPIIEKQRALPVKGKVYFVQRFGIYDVARVYNSRQATLVQYGRRFAEQTVAVYAVLADVTTIFNWRQPKSGTNF